MACHLQTQATLYGTEGQMTASNVSSGCQNRTCDLRPLNR